ncbi:hypothetical protein UZ36_07265 [Candidatus Nitromaritima sp. SCGC AAA799-C22]|nr:hypothetical protein UZ36_07265 [Candidatus Nitromaritima sp. SCGC AAA799-C22]
MTVKHPDFETLSAFSDGESGREPELKSHLKDCPSCREKVERLEAIKEKMGEVLVSDHHPSFTGKKPECPDSIALSGYLANALDSGEMGKLESHLRECDACLGEIMDARFVLDRMWAENLKPVPSQVRERVERILPSGEKVKEKIPEAIFRLVGKGIDLVKTEVEGMTRLDVIEVPWPEPAYRAKENDFGKGYEILLKEGDVHLQCLMRPMEENQIGLKITAKEKDHPLSNSRIYLYSKDQILASEKTDSSGKAEFLSLFPGDYIIKLPGVKTQLGIQILAKPLD